MSDGIFGISITGLRAAQMGLTTAGHNITNASTPGYNRQEIVQSSNTPLYTGSGFLGQGTNVSTVKRIYSQFLDNQVQSAQTKSSYLDTYYAQISQLDNLLADPSAGLSPALQDFFNGVHDVAANPASVPSRQSMLSSSEALVSRFQSLNQRFVEIRDGVNSQITSSVGLINSYAQQIATLNRQVVIAESGANGQPPNDLYDQRDKLIADLNKEINVSVVKQDDGSYNVFMGKGQALVVGQQALTLSARPMPDDPESMGVAYVSYGGSAQMLSSDSLDGGNLGGLLAFRSETLDKAQNELGRVAIGLAQTFNDQHRLGQDLNGDLGGYYFNVRGASGISGQNAFPSAKVVANTQNNSASGAPAVTLTDVTSVTSSDYRLSYSAAGYNLTRLSDNSVLWPGTTVASSANTGTGTISTASVTLPTNANLQQPVTITFHTPYDGQFDVTGTGTGNPTNVPYTSGGNITYNGWTVQISGAPVAGDTFTVPGISVDGLAFTAPVPAPTAGDSWLIQPTRDGAKDISVAIRDTAKIAAAAPIIAGADLVNNTGTGKISIGSVTAVDGGNPLTNITLTFDSANNIFNVTGGSPATLAYNPITDSAGKSFTLTQNGWSINVTLSGVPLSGSPADSFVIQKNTAGVSDNRNALLLAGLQTEKTLAGSTATYQSAYSQIVSSVGVKSRDISVTGQAQASLVAQTQQAQQSMSGVNLDEEAANLLRYQQAYQASGKMMQIASTLFETLLSLGQ